MSHRLLLSADTSEAHDYDIEWWSWDIGDTLDVRCGDAEMSENDAPTMLSALWDQFFPISVDFRSLRGVFCFSLIFRCLICLSRSLSIYSTFVVPLWYNRGTFVALFGTFVVARNAKTYHKCTTEVPQAATGSTTSATLHSLALRKILGWSP